MVNRRIAALTVSAFVAASIPSAVLAAGPDPDDRGFCPAGHIALYRSEFGGKGLGGRISEYRETHEMTFGQAVRLVCVGDGVEL